MRQLRFRLALFSLVLLSGCGGGNITQGGGPTKSEPMPTDSVSGTVTFKGSPLAGVSVTAFVTNTNSVYQVTTTEANGAYQFTGMQAYGNVPTDYQIWASKPGYGFYPSVGSGGKVTRADYTGQFQGNGVTDIAIYFTVIDYVALPNRSLSGANFTAYDGSNPLVSLPATGQQASYADGDDGAEQKGVAWTAAQRFTDHQDGTVTDTLTGLVWLKDAGCLAPAIWSGALTEVGHLASGACGLTDGSSAGDWRLPNLMELESMVDASANNPALSAGHPFVNVSGGVSWTSTSYFGGQGGSPTAWTIRLSDGRYMNNYVDGVKATAKNAVWAVKGRSGGAVKLQSTGMYIAYQSGDDGSLQVGVPPTYLRSVDNGNGTVTDTVTGLVWLR